MVRVVAIGLVALAVLIVRPAAAQPVNDAAAGLVGQTAARLCNPLDRATFTGTVEHAEARPSIGGVDSSGVWVVIVATVSNDGAVPAMPFAIAALIDERGRRFETPGTARERRFEAEEAARREFGAANTITDVQPGLSARVTWLIEVPATVESLSLVPAQTALCRG